MPHISKMVGPLDLIRWFPEPLYRVDELGGYKGVGLVATRNIKRGTHIFSEEVAVTRFTLQNSASIEAYNVQLRAVLRNVGNRYFYYEFLQLPRHPVSVFGPIGSFFDRNCIPTTINGCRFRFLGMISASLNHACVANAETTVLAHIRDGKAVCVVHVYACNDIDAGDEITVPYERVYMPALERKRRLFHKYAFRCECKTCVEDKRQVDNAMIHVGLEMDKLLSSWRTVMDPVVALHIGLDMKKTHMKYSFLDNRYPELYERCAMICGYHSDMGRVLRFLEKAKIVYGLNQGRNGPDARRMARLIANPRVLPYFGSSIRGYSMPQEKEVFRMFEADLSEEILWMQCVTPGNYLRLCDIPRYLHHRRAAELERAARKAEEEMQKRARLEANKVVEAGEPNTGGGENGTSPAGLDKAVSQLKLEDDEIVRQEQENKENGEIGKEE